MKFSLSIINLINCLVIALGIGVCMMCFLQITISKHQQKNVRRYFQVFFQLILVYIVNHLVRELLDGQTGAGIYVVLRVVTFMEMLSAGFMAYLMSMAILTTAKPEKGTKTIERILLGLLCLHAALLITDQFFGRVYYFDAGNLYHRGPIYLLCNLCPLIMMIFDVVLMIRGRNTMDRKVASAFWVYLIAPIIAITIQIFAYGLQLIIFATVGAALFLFAVIIRILNEKYEKQQQESARIETELNMATRIQADMLPNIFPAFPGRSEFDIFASMNPAKEVGGDFYDFFLIDEDHLCMVIADVSGKGVPAALFMMASKIILASHAALGKSPAEILTDANAAICSNNREEMFVTVWLGILELSTGKLVAANAGHEYPAICSAGNLPANQFTLYKDKHGFVIGGMDGVRYKEYEMQLAPGARLFLYTDGVPEATDAEKQLFGTERMLAALNKDAGASPEQLLKNVRAAVDSFVKDAEQFDDLTMLCVQYNGKKG